MSSINKMVSDDIDLYNNDLPMTWGADNGGGLATVQL